MNSKKIFLLEKDGTRLFWQENGADRYKDIGGNLFWNVKIEREKLEGYALSPFISSRVVGKTTYTLKDLQRTDSEEIECFRINETNYIQLWKEQNNGKWEKGEYPPAAISEDGKHLMVMAVPNKGIWYDGKTGNFYKSVAYLPNTYQFKIAPNGSFSTKLMNPIPEWKYREIQFEDIFN